MNGTHYMGNLHDWWTELNTSVTVKRFTENVQGLSSRFDVLPRKKIFIPNIPCSFQRPHLWIEASKSITIWSIGFLDTKKKKKSSDAQSPTTDTGSLASFSFPCFKRGLVDCPTIMEEYCVWILKRKDQPGLKLVEQKPRPARCAYQKGQRADWVCFVNLMAPGS